MVVVMDLKLSNATRFRVTGETQENEWSFGQIVAVVMLATIPVTVLKVIWGMDEDPRQEVKDYSQLRNFSSATDTLPRYHDSHDPESSAFNYQNFLESPISPASTDPRSDIPRAQTPDSITFRPPLRRTGSTPDINTFSSSRDFSNNTTKSRSFVPSKSSPMVSVTPLTSADWNLPLGSELSCPTILESLNTQFGPPVPMMTFGTPFGNSCDEISSIPPLDDYSMPTTNTSPQDSQVALNRPLFDKA
ncbi:hypothetical protein BZA77DRAFT_352450 [Pyronema omphalodes]|nr:hypothetical protein BZA77DRAFT_352450 [Pyronema omphalodes]